MDAQVLQKLGYKHGQLILMVALPGQMKPLIKDIKYSENYKDFTDRKAPMAVGFMVNSAALKEHWPEIQQASDANTRIWLCYPGENAAVPTDLSESTGWEAVKAEGYSAGEPVELDAIWTAIAFNKS